MLSFSVSSVVLTIALILLLAHPAHAFGAGNIASIARIEGTNWRHGDIEDTLLTLFMSRAAGGKKFDKMNVARVYFGNWLRDYSQAIDVGTVKYVSAEAIRILLWVLGFMTFGYGTKEFEVTAERLGCYRPEDHIDNPKDYADNLDAREYDPRLRGPVNERVELAIDPRTGLKNYIANEQAGIMTSALHVRKLFGRSIQLGRSFTHTGNKAELYEALRLLGTGLHCLEDYSAHSNYTELALIEMGERDVFPHVGRQTQIHLQGARGPVYPIVTGTFGGVDFLHSVMGEFDDKATQSEIQELQGTLQNGSQGDTSILKQLLASVPAGLFGGKDEAGKADELQANATAAHMNQMRVSPRKPEEFTVQMQQVSKEIYPIIQWHDEIMQSIMEMIEQIPVLPELITKVEDEINIFVFSLIAPFVVPIINQVKTELNEGSAEIIQSSKEKQLIVFNDDHSTDPTHSMLSKDHFSNVLNEPAGKIASQVLKWVVPQLIQCWDDERIDIDRTINRIINGVFHHPALRDQGQDGAVDGRRLMFGVVEGWWRQKPQYEQQELRRQLSRQGVQNGDNHKPGVQDTGHGCGKPLGMAKSVGGDGTDGGGMADSLIGGLTSALGGHPGAHSNQVSSFASDAVGGGALGGIVGALAGGIGGSLLSGAFGEEEPKTQGYASQGYNQQGNYQQKYTEVGHTGNQYAQAQYTETQLPGGGKKTEYQRYQQPAQGLGGSGFERKTEQYGTPGTGYGERTTEERWKKEGEREDEGENYERKKHHHKKHHDSESEDEDEPRRQEYGRGQGGHQETPRQQYGQGGYEDEGRRGFGAGYQPPRQEQFEGYQEPPREQYGQGRGGYSGRGGFEGRGGFGTGYQEPREEYGRGDYGSGQEPPPREEYGGRGAGYQPPREDYERREDYGRQDYEGGSRGGYGNDRGEYGGGRGGFGGGYEEPPRQEYGQSGGRGGYGYQEPAREEYGRRDEYGESRGGYGESGEWGERRGEEREEYREGEEEERREGGGGWYS